MKMIYSKKAQQIWDEIPISTMNALIMSFDAKIKTCITVLGESLNGEKKNHSKKEINTF